MKIPQVQRTVSKGVRAVTTPLKQIPQKLKQIPSQFKKIPKTLKQIPKTIQKVLSSLSKLLQTALHLPLVVQVLIAALVPAVLVGVVAGELGLTSPIESITVTFPPTGVELPSVPEFSVEIPLGVLTFTRYGHTISFLVLAALATWPAVVLCGLVYLWWTLSRHRYLHRISTAFTSVFLVKTGFLQAERRLAWPFVVGIGLVGTLLGSAGALWLGVARQWVVVVAAVTLLASPILVVVYLWQRNQAYYRDDLDILYLSTRDDGTRELALFNCSDDPVDMHKAKIRDANGKDYVLRRRVTLSPGETETFGLPESFALERGPRTIWLPLGFEIERASVLATIFTRAGNAYTLNWGETDDSWERDVPQSTD